MWLPFMPYLLLIGYFTPQSGSSSPSTKVSSVQVLGYVILPDQSVSALLKVLGHALPPAHRLKVVQSNHDCNLTVFRTFRSSLAGCGDCHSSRTLSVRLGEPAASGRLQTPDRPLHLCMQVIRPGQPNPVVTWMHLGRPSAFLLPPFGTVPEPHSRIPRALQENDLSEGRDPEPVSKLSRITAIQLEEISKDVSYSDEGVITVRQGFPVQLRVSGFGLSNDSQVKLTSIRADAGAPCKSHGLHLQSESYTLIDVAPDGTSAAVIIPSGALPVLKGEEVLFVCLRNNSQEHFIHQGISKGLQIEVYELILPVWLIIAFICVLLCLSGLFSGLNLGLMALDQTELKIVQNTGTDRERSYADKIAPIRSHGNFLLCSLLLGNVLVNNTLTILLDTLTSGLVAVIGATLGIVVFGEIIPQAICSRHGLAVGAYTIWLTKLFMLLTFPLSYPISKILDQILGAEIGTVYDKKRLIELLRVTKDTNDLEKEEVDIVTGALVYKEKTVRSVMTPIEDCYLLNVKTVLNFDTISEIREQGYSRIPVYDGHRNNIVHVLFVKDLMFIDPDNDTPLTTVCEFYKNNVNFVFHDTPLNVMFNEFKSGEKGHMAFVQDVNSSGDGDPFYETIGLVTLEDIIEEIIQQEIIDETDVILDNRTKKRRKRSNYRKTIDAHFPILHQEHKRVTVISAQLTLAVFQYLTTALDPFRPSHISDLVLKKLLTMDIYREIKIKKASSILMANSGHCAGGSNQDEEELFIVKKGKPIDHFVLIIEGRVQASVGKEELIFESGPFAYFGVQVLNQVLVAETSPMSPSAGSRVVSTPPSVHSGMVPMSHRKASGADLALDAAFVPDYTIKAVTDVIYMCLRRATYIRALKATQMSRRSTQEDTIDSDLDRFLQKVNEDDTDVDVQSTGPVFSPKKRFDQLVREPSAQSGRQEALNPQDPSQEPHIVMVESCPLRGDTTSTDPL